MGEPSTPRKVREEEEEWWSLEFTFVMCEAKLPKDVKMCRTAVCPLAQLAPISMGRVKSTISVAEDGFPFPFTLAQER